MANKHVKDVSHHWSWGRYESRPCIPVECPELKTGCSKSRKVSYTTIENAKWYNHFENSLTVSQSNGVAILLVFPQKKRKYTCPYKDYTWMFIAKWLLITWS
jgi:hypothetical protein